MPGNDLEVLVHNLGHHDLYVEVEGETGDRPAIGLVGSVFTQSASNRLLACIEAQSECLVTADGHRLVFDTPVDLDWSPAKWARRVVLKPASSPGAAQGLRVHALHIPLVSAAVEMWLRHTAPEADKVLLLTSSRIPVGELKGTSTEGVARIVKRFVEACTWFADSNLSVQLVPPLEEDPFLRSTMPRYTREQLRPPIDALRQQAVARHGDEWAAHFRVTLSLSTGTPPMMDAIRTALRFASPSSVHLPRARQHLNPENPPQASWVPFEDIEQAPPLPQAQVRDPYSRQAIDVMRQWSEEMAPVWAADERSHEEKLGYSELRDFWLRKGKKPVLAVVVIDRDGSPTPYRAMNLEVSLPTGTLCAERNAIGSALADNPTLHRRDIRAVAVLSLIEEMNPLAPCGACNEWLRKIAEANPALQILAFKDTGCETVFVREVS